MPRGSLASVVERYATHQLTVLRDVAGSVTVAGTVDAMVDFTPSGTLQAGSALGQSGITASTGVGSVYLSPDQDLRVGDEFAWSNALYRVEMVTPVGGGPSGDSIKIAYVRAKKAPGSS